MKKRILIGMAILAICSTSLFAASQDLTAIGKKNLTSANMHLSGDRYEKAIPFYELVLEENPHHILALNKMGGIFFDMKKDYKKANEIYSALLDEIDDVYAEYDALLETDTKAAKKFHKKYIKKADLDDMKEITPKLMQRCWVKLFLEAQTEFKADNLESSLDKFLYVLEIAPDSVKTLKMISMLYSNMGDSDQSYLYMVKAAEKDPKDDLVRTMIGNTNFANDNYEESIIWYLESIEINPENTDNYFNMALAYNKLKDDENTLMAYEKVIEYEPNNLDALIYASEILDKLGNEEKSLSYLEYAILEYKKILDEEPDNVDVLTFISSIYEKLDDMDQSINYLKQAIDLDPDNLEWVSYLAYTLTREQRFEEALIYATKWLELNPNSEDAKLTINLAKQKIKK